MVFDALKGKADIYYKKKIVKNNFKLLRQYTEIKSKRHNLYLYCIDNIVGIKCLLALITRSFQISYYSGINNTEMIQEISYVTIYYIVY